MINLEKIKNIGKFFSGLIIGFIIFFYILMAGYGTYRISTRPLNKQTVTEMACRVVMRNPKNCGSVNPSTILFDGSLENVPKFDVNDDRKIDSSDTLQILCETYYGTEKDNQSECRRVCGCAE